MKPGKFCATDRSWELQEVRLQGCHAGDGGPQDKQISILVCSAYLRDQVPASARFYS